MSQSFITDPNHHDALESENEAYLPGYDRDTVYVVQDLSGQWRRNFGVVLPE